MPLVRAVQERPNRWRPANLRPRRGVPPARRQEPHRPGAVAAAAEQRVPAGVIFRDSNLPRRISNGVPCEEGRSNHGESRLVAMLRGGKHRRQGQRRVDENLEDGMTIDEIIEQYPISRDEIKAVLDFAAHSLDRAPSF